MSVLKEIGDALLGVIGLTTVPSTSIYWPYLLSAWVLATGVYVVRTPGRTFRGWLGFCFPRAIYTHPSVRDDLLLFFTNTLLYSYLLFGPISAASTFVAERTQAFFSEHVGWVLAPGWGLVASALYTLVIFLVADFVYFVAHLAQHKVPFLWEFHKVHHSAEVLVPLTVFRRHPVDVCVERGLAGIALGALVGGTAFFTGGSVDELAVLGVNAGFFALMLLGFNLQHSHVPLSFGRVLEHVFVSPALHQLHHSRSERHVDKNLGNLLALWDWAFGTLALPERGARLELGLADGESRNYRGLPAIYVVPFVRTFARIARVASKPEGKVRRT